MEEPACTSSRKRRRPRRLSAGLAEAQQRVADRLASWSADSERTEQSSPASSPFRERQQTSSPKRSRESRPTARRSTRSETSPRRPCIRAPEEPPPHGRRSRCFRAGRARGPRGGRSPRRRRDYAAPQGADRRLIERIEREELDVAKRIQGRLRRRRAPAAGDTGTTDGPGCRPLRRGGGAAVRHGREERTRGRRPPARPRARPGRPHVRARGDRSSPSGSRKSRISGRSAFPAASPGNGRPGAAARRIHQFAPQTPGAVELELRERMRGLAHEAEAERRPTAGSRSLPGADDDLGPQPSLRPDFNRRQGSLLERTKSASVAHARDRRTRPVRARASWAGACTCRSRPAIRFTWREYGAQRGRLHRAAESSAKAATPPSRPRSFCTSSAESLTTFSDRAHFWPAVSRP